MEVEPNYRYLDSEQDRQALVDDMAQVRQAVIAVARMVPEDQHFTPRYHDWSLAAMLGHLMLMDSLNMWLIQSALLGLRLQISMDQVDRLNGLLARVFRQRVVESSIKGIEQKEKRLADFILQLPVDKFTQQVYYPPRRKFLTVERGIQDVFLFHWQEHLETMLAVEGIEDPRNTSAL